MLFQITTEDIGEIQEDLLSVTAWLATLFRMEGLQSPHTKTPEQQQRQKCVGVPNSQILLQDKSKVI